MSECSFCGVLEEKHYPLCHVCGSIRYPVEKDKITGELSRHQKKLKLTASVAAAIVIPGAFIFLAASHINTKIKNRKL
ncbi:hypothetical protein [methanotrophic endosymbiont of Bathymodiolus puteoserpentis (Logatchev)]|jgi:hypothetical protein|uniref:hypothetical protein n=1 Tax=methanotrophic endosymbiont of Bathymodiolus puteoserpentis (Logatchev) TaxID=343235 RepID=UPI0013CD49D3|nr:hypothetical protein [methanotrophic endosymbiont of Bathymodiolus puteoserpentis (Logatchev)]SHE19630.1 hypothetical protein BPUTEOMOX_2217 [methanotrophic endosymbiont of Bathymodiolus puteoserpentis (Logatchev)]